MALRRWTLALASGTAVFLVVAVAVTAALESRIWPSAVVGLPVGTVAGLAALAYVYRRVDRPSGLALAVYGAVFLPALAVLWLASVRLSTAVLAASVVAALAGIASTLDDRIGRRIR